jgi:hypothetical protein
MAHENYICAKCNIYHMCDTHDICYTMTQCDTQKQKKMGEKWKKLTIRELN